MSTTRKSKTPSPTTAAEAQRKYQLLQFLIERVTSAFRTGARWGGICYVFYVTNNSIQSLAGRQTDANIMINGKMDLSLFANRYASQIIFGLFGGGGVFYGLGQRKLYRKAAEKLKRSAALESIHDPHRTSSGLRNGWENNPNDPE